ncbi:TIGR03862 family flavoprotein [Chloroflexota bacterium]
MAVVGGGPAGLMAAEVLAGHGHIVDLYESKPGAGRKFLVAGKGGLNITHSEPFDQFILKYGDKKGILKPILKRFGPGDLQNWVNEMGFETFVGTSGRVFPVGMKSSPILRTWLRRLNDLAVRFHYRHQWLGWNEKGLIQFNTPGGKVASSYDVLIIALGGGSRPELGSDANWIPILQERGVEIQPLKPSNCGFNTSWSDVFRTRFEGQPVRQVSLKFRDCEGNNFEQQGEFIISSYGLEGSLIYAASALIREEIGRKDAATIYLDLAPDWSLGKLEERLSRVRGKTSISNHLRKSIGFEGVKTGLLREILPPERFNQAVELAASVKNLPITLHSARPLAEAISSAGGVTFESVDEKLMIKNLPGVFCAGEMLDWEAPTGGYLLTACFSTGYHAGVSALNYLELLQV